MKKIRFYCAIILVLCMGMCACANSSNQNNETSGDASAEQELHREERTGDRINKEDRDLIVRINSEIEKYEHQIAGIGPNGSEEGFRVENDENNIGCVRYYNQDNELVKVSSSPWDGLDHKYYFERGSLICLVRNDYLSDMQTKFYFKEETLQCIELLRYSNGETLATFCAPFEESFEYQNPENEDMRFKYTPMDENLILRDAKAFLNNWRLPA